MIGTVEIEHILEHFDIELSNYEIVNIDEKKGWSAKYLYLIVEKNEQFILKGKSEDQISGFLDDIEISNYLASKGFSVRKPIKTHDGDFHFVKEGIYWDLKTYIPATVLEFADYNESTIESLAKVNTSYIKSSLNDPSIKRLNLKTKDFSDLTELINNIDLSRDVLNKVIGNSTDFFLNWLTFSQNEVKRIIKNTTDFCIIHNDLNNKNILINLETMNVVSFIDWDHGCISTPLKDIIEPINMFYDFLPQKYDIIRARYIDEIKTNYTLPITDSELTLLQVYFYTLNKWNYVITFARLISKLGNTTNEQTKFEDIINTQINRLRDIGKKYNIY